ncbi:hypothetical protein DWY90_09840 [Coprococcus sp. AF27-8]|nr:hypothetical protein DWY90_09840 [Coprococcus sp. AF27-8]
MADIFSLVGRVSVEYAQAETALDRISDAAEETADSLEDVGDSAEGAGGTTEKSGNRMSSALKKIGSAVVAAFAVDKIVDFGKTLVEASATVAAEQSAFEQIMGDYSDTAQQKINEIADTTGMVSTRLTPYMTSMTAKFKGLGYDIDDATTLAQDGLTLAADAAAFWDKSLEDSMGALNSFINGSYEGGEAIGLFANDTQLASYAVKQGIVSEAKEWANLDEAKKQATRLQYAQDMMAASGATGQAAKEADQYANVQANLTEKWRQFKSQIGEPLLQNVVIPAMGKLSAGVDKASAAYQKCSKWISEHKTELEIAKGVLIGLTVAVSSFLLIMNWGKIMATAKAALLGIKTAMLAVNAAMKANPIGLVISLIAGLVAGFLYLWNTSEEFRNFWIGLWETIKTTASGVWEAIKSAADNVITALQTGWEAFTTFFSTLWTNISNAVSTAWEFIKNVVSVGLQTIGLIISAAVQIIALPFQFIWENCKGIIQKAWDKIKNIVTVGVNVVKTVITVVFNAIKAYITIVVNIWQTIISTAWNVIKTVVTTVVNAIKNVVTTVWNAISSVTSSVFNAIKSVASSVWNSIKSVITSVVNGIKSTVSNIWNSIKSTTSSVFESIKSTASSVWNSIKSAIETPINAAKNAVKSAIDKMKSFFDFSWSLPPIKLPHISIKGEFSLKPPSVPSFGIEWYKKAMNNPVMFTRPTIFGMDPITGNVRGAGEAGAEIMIGRDTMLGMIKEAVSAESKKDDIVAALFGILELLSSDWLKNTITDVLVNNVRIKWRDRELGRMVRQYD